VSVSRRGLALCASLPLLFAAPATADAVVAHKAHGNTKPAVKKVKAPRADWDHDGLNNRYERRARTRPRQADSDGDGVRDGAEDRDGDTVDNLTEQRARTRPGRRDSDRDGVSDAAEDPDRDGLSNHGESVTAMHPRKPDTDGDGITDGDEHAGTVLSVDGDLVTIALAAGGELVARVTADSDVLCAADDGWADDEDSADDEDTGDDTGDDTADDAGDDDAGDDEDPAADDPEARVLASVSSACLAPGMTVYEADLETFGGALVFSVIDLLGG
jgi:hypothetical protein